MDPFTFLLIMGLNYIISQAMMKSPKVTNAKPGEFQLPNIEEGRLYPVVFGTPERIIDSTVAWWGNTKNVPIKKKVSDGGLFHGDKYQIVGYRYYLGMHLKPCHGVIDGIKQIYVGDKLVWPNPNDPTELAADGQTAITINKPYLFGGEESEGGIQGSIDIQYGASTQTVNSYLAARLGAGISANRGLVSVILKQVYIGTSPYIKLWAFLVKRTQVLDDGSPQWYLAKADISGSLNAAHILRECFTNQRWGLKQSTALFDDVIWQPVADKLYTEGFGLSALWKQDMEIEEFIEEIKRHINAVIYKEPTTGKFIIKLIRDDYDIEDLEDLEAFDGNDITSVDDLICPSLGRTPDQIFVEYWDIINNKTASVPNEDGAMISAQGKTIPVTMPYHYITDADLAGRVVSRELRVQTSMTKAMKISAKRTMAHLRPGDVFKWNSAALGISNMVIRIAKGDYGTLRSNKIEFEAAQDVWGLPAATYSAPPDTGWINPVVDPAEAPNRILLEATFYALLKAMGVSNATALAATSGFLMVGAERPSDGSFDYELLVRDAPAGDFESEGTGAFTPTATLVDNMPMNAVNVEIELENENDLDLVNIGDYAQIGDEIFAVLDIDTANLTVDLGRGVLDTVPEAHTAGDRIWFIDSAKVLVQQEYTDGDTPGAKILPRTGNGELAEGDATAYNATAFDSRQARPYPPGDFEINTVSYPASFTGEPTLTWKHRDRLLQTTLVAHNAASIGPEAGTTYTLKIYGDGGTLKRTVTGITAETYTYADADEKADNGGNLNSSLRFELYSVRDGLDSWQKYDVTVPRT